MPKKRNHRRRPIRVHVLDAIECMVPTLTEAQGDILLASTVKGQYVGPGDCHRLSTPGRSLPSDEVLFYVARRTGARIMLFGSRSVGEIAEVHEPDVDLCARLVRAAERNGIHVIDHIVVRDGMFRFMSESTSLWAPGTGLRH